MDDVIQNKVATIEKCLKRILEESKLDWKNNFSHQDSLLLNIERACQASIDIAMHIVRRKKLGIPKLSREAFEMMEQAGIIDEMLSQHMKKMVGFRNLAVHDYASLNLKIVESILEKELVHFKTFCALVINLE
ncbi:MAG: hypothetical protein ACJA08_000771 [Cyclobacteriaceae bacterium]|jgi:uncharacterized protein YutE (UPF0331/DUF86 family)